MTNSNSNDFLSNAWQNVRQRAQQPAPLPDIVDGPLRQVMAAGLTLDYSKARINDEVVTLLAELAAAGDLPAHFRAMFDGAAINHTEGRAVGHTRLRDPDANDEVSAEMQRMLAFADSVASGKFRLPNDTPVKAIVHVGIGGSYLGPKLYYEAFPATIACRFLANIDPAAYTDTLKGLEPASTLLVSVSKSGTTAETLTNTQIILDWIATVHGSESAVDHLITVSTNPQMATQLKCKPAQAFRLWEWVGGRYSIWSPVAVSVAAACGVDAFRDFLAGAHAMDEHVCSTTGFDNFAVTLALLRAWHALACAAQTHCVVAYQHRLRAVPAYLQQLVMESNGKSTTTYGVRPHAPTSAIWWGGEGTNDQHSYYQLLLQGMHTVPADFILGLHAQTGEDAQMQMQLLANALGQSRALLLGRDLATSERQLLDSGMTAKEAAKLAPHLTVAGGQPSNLVYFDRLTPHVLGALLAAYEHMTATLGWLWQINSFDQWGVELGKINFRQVFDALHQGNATGMDVTTRQVINKLRS